MTTNNDELDLLSIDIGINTFHILEHIEIKPRVIVTEYNAKLRDKIEWVSDYNKDGEWVGDDNFGASLNSFFKNVTKKKLFSSLLQYNRRKCFLCQK